MNRPLNIGVVCYPTYGGSGIVATELGVHTANLGHNVHFISYNKPLRLPHFHPNIRFHQVSIRTYPLFEYPPYDLALASKILEVKKSTGLDVLHVHYAIPHAISAWLACHMLGNGDLKFITTLHGTDVTLVGQDPSYLPVVKFALEHSTRVTAVSEFLRQQTYDTFEVDIPIDVILNFVDTDIFKPEARQVCRSNFAPNEEKVLVHLSNFRPVKQAPMLIETLVKIRKKVPAVLLMIGDGPERQHAEALAGKAGVAEHVFFLGSQDNVEEILPTADLFMLPSLTESFGLAALEAMACGVPVIASNTGGLPELLDDSCGRLFPVGNAEAMANAAIGILTDSELLGDMKINARNRACAMFSLDKRADQYEQLYQEIVGA